MEFELERRPDRVRSKAELADDDAGSDTLSATGMQRGRLQAISVRGGSEGVLALRLPANTIAVCSTSIRADTGSS